MGLTAGLVVEVRAGLGVGLGVHVLAEVGLAIGASSLLDRPADVQAPTIGRLSAARTASALDRSRVLSAAPDAA